MKLKQKKNKNYLRQKINYNICTTLWVVYIVLSVMYISLSVVRTTLSVMYITLSVVRTVGCKNRLCQLYAILCRL